MRENVKGLSKDYSFRRMLHTRQEVAIAFMLSAIVEAGRFLTLLIA